MFCSVSISSDEDLQMRTIIWDLIAFAGVAAIAGSTAWIYPPAGLIVLGAGLVLLGGLGARRASKNVSGASLPTMAEKADKSGQDAPDAADLAV
jgi:hypothetical protein